MKRKVSPGDTVFVFFAGHGIAFGGTNLLLPSDIPAVDAEAEQLVRQFSVSENDVIDGLREKGASLVILTLDACRKIQSRSSGGRKRAVRLATIGQAA